MPTRVVYFPHRQAIERACGASSGKPLAPEDRKHRPESSQREGQRAQRRLSMCALRSSFFLEQCQLLRIVDRLLFLMTMKIFESFSSSYQHCQIADYAQGYQTGDDDVILEEFDVLHSFRNRCGHSESDVGGQPNVSTVRCAFNIAIEESGCKKWLQPRIARSSTSTYLNAEPVL